MIFLKSFSKNIPKITTGKKTQPKQKQQIAHPKNLTPKNKTSDSKITAAKTYTNM